MFALLWSRVGDIYMKRINFIIVILVSVVPAMTFARFDAINTYLDRLEKIRYRIRQIDALMPELALQRKDLEKRIEDLALKIRARKADSSQSKLLPDFTLQQMLSSSHDASGALGAVNKQIEDLNRESRDLFEKFLEVHRSCLVEAEKLFDTVSIEKRTELFEVLHALRIERDMIDRRLHARTRLAKPFDTGKLLDTNDPEELKERADAIRDEQDRLRKRLADLKKRVEDIKIARRFDRQVRDFKKEQMLFAERSRIFQFVGSWRMSAEVDYPALDDIPRPIPDAESKDFSSLDLLEPCLAASCEPGIESGMHPGIDHTNATPEDTNQIEQNVDKKQLAKPRRTSDAIRILTRAQEDTIQQIKRLQILYDRIMEKTEILETE